MPEYLNFGNIAQDEYISYMLLEYQGKAKMNDLMKKVILLSNYFTTLIFSCTVKYFLKR